MLSVLLVDDEQEKTRLITAALMEVSGFKYEWIEYATNVISAKTLLQKKSFDVLLLDINLPKRADDLPEASGGMEIVRWLRSGGKAHQPQHLIATTAYENSAKLAKPDFDNILWTLVPFSHDSDQWKRPLKNAISLILEAPAPPFRNDGATYRSDIGIVVALEGVELQSILDLPAGWKQTKSRFDDARYHIGTFSEGDRTKSVAVVAAPNKGMSFTAVAASKLIASFRPRYLVMSGICAGIAKRVELGDVVFADPSWDWGSGKIKNVDGKARLEIAPYQIRMSEDVRSKALAMSSDAALLAEIKKTWRGDKPATELKVHIGAVASGASVLESRNKTEELVESHKDLKAVEMEIFAALCAAEYAEHPKPKSFALKGVCDFGDESKNDSCQSYAAHVSAQVLYHFVMKYLD